MDKCSKTSAVYIATLKSIYNIAQSNHWKAKGSNFYSSHLLFQRIYEETQKNLDEASEKFIGLFGEDCLNNDLQIKLEYKVMKKYKSLDSFDQLIKIISDFIEFSIFAYKCFESENKLSMGLDDMLMSISSKQEENMYLLKQSTKN